MFLRGGINVEISHARSVNHSGGRIIKQVKAYASKFIDELEGKPSDREILQQFVQSVGQGPILDVGCGPGHTTAYIHSLGGKATGIDLSPCMIEQAKQIFPDCEFEVGDFMALSAQTESVGGILAFYCIVHLEPAQLSPAFAEFYRILQNRGVLLLAFHVGTEVVRAENFLGTKQCSIFDSLKLPMYVMRYLKLAFVIWMFAFESLTRRNILASDATSLRTRILEFFQTRGTV